MKPVKRVAVIHDLSGIGKAALTNVLPILSIMGIEACPIPTMILSTHTGGFGTPEVVKLSGFIERCNTHYKKNGIEFNSIFIGYLGGKEEIESSIKFIKENKCSNVFLDPIFGDQGKYYSNFDLDYVNSIKKIISFSDIITPNYTEACYLTGEDYFEDCTESKLKRICEGLIAFGTKKIVITSVPSKNDKLLGVGIYDGEKLKIIFREKLGKSYPGTGDIFTSVLIGKILRGSNLYESALFAHNFVSKCIDDSSKYNYETKEGVLLERNLKFLL
ncbi:pyridoxamine kinase [Clostridium sp. SHJSY1]|uniref:pyridoxamine kinase n=1 Tax=Clostridium sp. SHJSY1 TaxID=2942483 RepID=UPI002876DCF4|nr:pyridoxamine kinase [Clostridium sp. SHJSY1]MDS0524362.1 pyridoxamine kinase [Clostridium sp. SHJSY1]